MKDNADIKVLQITSGFRKGVSGGIPSTLFNLTTAKPFDDDQVGFDYLALGYQTFEPYRKDFEQKGSLVENLDIHTKGLRQKWDIIRKLIPYIRRHNYDIIHINSGALTQMMACAIAAKLAGSKRVIVHSHNAMIKSSFTNKVFKLLKPIFNIAADDYFACAEMAADSMFPPNILKGKKWVYIPNAIDINRFLFNPKIREEYRKELGVENDFVIGHVGRFVNQKNHKLIIKVFSEVVKVRKNVKLLLVGTGELKDEIMAHVKDLGIEDKVLFAGQRRDANNMLQAMDLFLFPSYYEGLGMVVIEAQAAGLKVIASDSIPIMETQISDLISYLPISKPEMWVEQVLKVPENYPRQNTKNLLVENGYELQAAAENLKKIYRS